jgi:hypothetical protein
VTNELGESLALHYMQLIGILRWAVELGWISIYYEVSVLSQYQANPSGPFGSSVTHQESWLGHSAKNRESGIFGTQFLKMQILRFHDLIAKIGIAKIGIAKIGIPILAIHPDRDPDFSDPSRSGSQFF